MGFIYIVANVRGGLCYQGKNLIWAVDFISLTEHFRLIYILTTDFLTFLPTCAQYLLSRSTFYSEMCILSIHFIIFNFLVIFYLMMLAKVSVYIRVKFRIWSRVQVSSSMSEFVYRCVSEFMSSRVSGFVSSRVFEIVSSYTSEVSAGWDVLGQAMAGRDNLVINFWFYSVRWILTIDFHMSFLSLFNQFWMMTLFFQHFCQCVAQNVPFYSERCILTVDFFNLYFFTLFWITNLVFFTFLSIITQDLVIEVRFHSEMWILTAGFMLRFWHFSQF